MAEVTYFTEGSLAFIKLDRPKKLNALTPDMLAEIHSCIRRAEVDMSLRALILHAEGKAFSVGADINIWSALTPEAFRTSWIDAGHRAFDALARCRLPVIAALQGMAFGGGLELALAADLRIADQDALLALPEASLGTVPGWGGTQRLTEIIGRSRAKQMILTAMRVEAVQAEAWGLVNATCASGAVLETAKTMAVDIARLAPISVQIAKKLIDGSAGDGLSATLEMLGGMATQTTRDLDEGITALREKRKPHFIGS
jgi:enoyl-CoA hydratase